MTKHRSVFISGGGPAGLAAALLFDQLGWEEIVLAERRASPQDFEKNKSFNYNVDLRGQRILDQLGIVDRLPECGVPTTTFTATTITTDGDAVTQSVPIIDPDRPTCYWTTRRALLTMLYDAIAERASDRVKILYGHTVRGLDSGPAKAVVSVESREGETLRFEPDLILACDGLNSTIRKAAHALPDVPDDHFAMIGEASLSTGLRYKVLNLPSKFEAKGGKAAVDDNLMPYVIPSRHKDPRKACALFAFPVYDPAHPRSVNLIREADHELWTLKTAEELYAFLEDAFPQLDIPALVPREEADAFVSLEAGSFPKPQHARNLHAAIGPDENPTQLLMIGDAAHAFPPDLGLGVNAALQDLTVLHRHLVAEPELAEAARAYAAERLPEARNLAWMVRHTFPEQYQHRPWRFKAWALGFAARKALHKLAPALFDKPGFLLSQDPNMSYGEMRLRKQRTDFRVRALGVTFITVLLAAVTLALI